MTTRQYTWDEWQVVKQIRREEYRAKVLAAAMSIAREKGYRHITRNDLAARAGVGAGTVNLYFKTMNELRDEVLRQAVAGSEFKIISQGLAAAHPITAVLPASVKMQALSSCV